MAALHSPFSGENMNLQLLVEKIEKCVYPDLPDDLFSFEVKKSFIIKKYYLRYISVKLFSIISYEI